MHKATILSDADRIVRIQYTNYKGEVRYYRIIPHAILFKRTAYHAGPEQWFINATDVERNVVREFAIKDIHSWKPET